MEISFEVEPLIVLKIKYLLKNKSYMKMGAFSRIIPLIVGISLLGVINAT
jgi:hypothetical protein